MTRICYVIALSSALFLTACGGGQPPSTTESDGDSNRAGEPAAPDDGIRMVDGVKTKSVPGFGGVIAESYEDSEEWWAPYKEPKADAPNVIIFLLDDVG
ncbi:MAG: hypothetical protein ACR2QV_05545, partial [Gammaproteobacteria bacterium]